MSYILSIGLTGLGGVFMMLGAAMFTPVLLAPWGGLMSPADQRILAMTSALALVSGAVLIVTGVRMWP